jgi:hypothetical protein
LLTAPHRSNRHRAPPQDGRILCRYRWPWMVKRTFAWLGNLLLVVRYNRSLEIYPALFPIVCFMIVLWRVVQKFLEAVA